MNAVGIDRANDFFAENGWKAVLAMMTATPDNAIITVVFKKVSKAIYDSLISL